MGSSAKLGAALRVLPCFGLSPLRLPRADAGGAAGDGILARGGLARARLSLMLLRGRQLCRRADGRLALLASSSKRLMALLGVSWAEPVRCPLLGGGGGLAAGGICCPTALLLTGEPWAGPRGLNTHC